MFSKIIPIHFPSVLDEELKLLTRSKMNMASMSTERFNKMVEAWCLCGKTNAKQKYYN